jgi:hypothetical protein
MSKQRKILLTILAGTLALSIALMMGLQHKSHELAARDKLDSLLGQADETLPADNIPFTPYPSAPAAPAPSTPPSGSGTPNGSSQPPGAGLGLPILNPFAGGIPDSGVDVQESPTAYVLRIPLLNAEDAHNVKANVTPHHIEISGNIGRREQNATYTSSFVQSFSTSQTVLPEKMTQKTVKSGDKTELVITIPKKQSGQPSLSPSAPPPAPAAPTAPKSTEAPVLDDDGNEHRVI